MNRTRDGKIDKITLFDDLREKIVSDERHTQKKFPSLNYTFNAFLRN
jgi:hypothetical protein